MSNYKLIALDMDGTLLRSDHWTIPQQNIDALRRAQAAGVHVCINTGRMLEDASDFLRRYELDCMVISGDGTRVCTGPAGRGEIVFRKDLTPQEAQTVLGLSLSSGLTIHAFEDGYVNTVLSEDGMPYHVLSRPGILGVRYGEDALYAAAQRGLMKIFIVSGGFAGSVYDERVEPLRAALKEALPQLEIASSGAGNIEIVSGGAGKGRALDVLAGRLGLTREEVMAVGDAGNDLNMLEYAYHSVAMANARPEVLSACRYTTGRNDEGGVAQIINRVLAAK